MPIRLLVSYVWDTSVNPPDDLRLGFVVDVAKPFRQRVLVSDRVTYPMYLT